MSELLGKILGTAILLMLRCSQSISPDSSMENTTQASDFISRNIILDTFLNHRKFAPQLANIENNKIDSHSNDLIEKTSDEPRSYYSSISAAPFIPAFDPISVLASLAFMAFLLQSFAALFDRTRSLLPTINSRKSSLENHDQFIDLEKNGILRALDEYTSLEKDLVNNENESKHPFPEA